VETGTEAVQFPEKEYINEFFVAMRHRTLNNIHEGVGNSSYDIVDIETHETFRAAKKSRNFYNVVCLHEGRWNTRKKQTATD
jgi:hypothetical protein